MLAQAARAAAKSSLLRQASTPLRPSIASSLALASRSYAKKYTKPPYEERVQALQNQSARQTSSGTSVPRDQSWKPADAIKFGGSAAAARNPSSQGGQSQTAKSSEETAEFNKASDPSVNTAPTSQPGPTSGAADISNPTPGTASDPGSANEELRGPQDAAVNTEPEESTAPKGPLPDLRQGIPSTFAKEFGFGQQAESSADADANESGSSRRPPQNDEEFSQEDYETSTDRSRAKLARIMYAVLAVSVVTSSAYFGRPYAEAEPAPNGLDPKELTGWDPKAVWSRIKSRLTGSVEYYTEPTSKKLLPDMPAGQQFPYTLVVSLEDLLIHSEWSREHGWRTAKRPGVDYFLRYLSQYFEIVVFTSVPSAMGDPVIRKLDPFRLIMWPLFREATKYENGKYIKDLAYLNRPLGKTIIVDTDPDHVRNQPENAIVLPKWKGDAKDPNAKDLVALIPFLEYIACTSIPDVRRVMQSFAGKDIPQEFARREAIAREAFNKQHQARAAKPSASVGGFLASALGMQPRPQDAGADPDAPGQTISEGLVQGKMLGDQIRENGQRAYRRIEEEIRVNGEKWLKDMEEEEKKLMEVGMQDMKKNWFGSLMGGGKGKEGEGK